MCIYIYICVCVCVCVFVLWGVNRFGGMELIGVGGSRGAGMMRWRVIEKEEERIKGVKSDWRWWRGG